MGKIREESDGAVLTKEVTKTKEPPLYRVILLNDDYTSMEFVILILEQVFHKSHAEATQIMFAVHEKGTGVAGIYPKEIAETKITAVHSLATCSEFPLRCSMEPVS